MTGWAVGDTVTVGPIRWIIRALNPRAKGVQVQLEAANAIGPRGMRWNTRIKNLPKKAVR